MDHMLGEMNDVPILFLDALKGWFMPVRYYSPNFKEWIKGRDDCKWVDIDCCHWMMDNDVGDVQSLYTHLDAFLAE